MNTQELKKLIAEAQHPEWFENISLSLNFPMASQQLKFDNFSSVYQYFQTQLEGWKAMENKIPPAIKGSFDFFNNVFSKLNQIAVNAKNFNETQLNNNWREVTNATSNNRVNNIFTYDCPETEFLIKLNEEQPAYINDVYNFLISFSNNQTIHLNNAKNFNAYTLAYEFLQRDHTHITERRKAEKASITRIRNDFQKYLSTSENQLNQFLKESKQKTDDNAKLIDETREAKETNFENWYKEVKEKHEKFVEETNESRKDLEKTYRELLRLQEPAKYWEDRATDLKKEGWKYLIILSVLVLLGAGSLFALLILLPGQTFEKIFDSTGMAIKWSIVFITFISFLAYSVGLLAKTTFSSFHLARDAEERKQLTYLYLSLKKDGNVEDKDRQLVLQSLFSRADTGLIKEDSSPTMPGASNFLNKIIAQ